MRLLWACGLAALLGLSACTGASTGVRSPCHGDHTGASTQRLSFVAKSSDISEVTSILERSGKAPYGCNFQNS